MTTNQLRTWVIASSLAITATLFLFVVVAPNFGYPLRNDQPTRILQIVLPTLFGYLSSATHFAFGSNEKKSPALPNGSIAALLMRGSMIVWSLMMAATLFSFGWSNRAHAEPGQGMSIDDLSKYVTASLVLLTSTASIAVTYLFAAEKKAMGDAEIDSAERRT